MYQVGGKQRLHLLRLHAALEHYANSAKGDQMSCLPRRYVRFWAIAIALMVSAGELRAGIVLVTNRSDLGGPGVGGNDSVNWGSLGPSGTVVVPSTTMDQTFSIVSTARRTMTIESAADTLAGGGANLTVGMLSGPPAVLNNQLSPITTPPLPEFDPFLIYHININFNTPVSAAGADVLAQATRNLLPGQGSLGQFEVVALGKNSDGTMPTLGFFFFDLGDSAAPTAGFYGVRSDSGPNISTLEFLIQFQSQSRFRYDAGLTVNQVDFLVPPAVSVPEPSTLITGATAAVMGLGWTFCRRRRVRAASRT